MLTNLILINRAIISILSHSSWRDRPLWRPWSCLHYRWAMGRLTNCKLFFLCSTTVLNLNKKYSFIIYFPKYSNWNVSNSIIANPEWWKNNHTQFNHISINLILQRNIITKCFKIFFLFYFCREQNIRFQILWCMIYPRRLFTGDTFLIHYKNIDNSSKPFLIVFRIS